MYDTLGKFILSFRCLRRILRVDSPLSTRSSTMKDEAIGYIALDIFSGPDNNCDITIIVI